MWQRFRPFNLCSVLTSVTVHLKNCCASKAALGLFYSYLSGVFLKGQASFFFSHPIELLSMASMNNAIVTWTCLLICTSSRDIEHAASLAYGMVANRSHRIHHIKNAGCLLLGTQLAHQSLDLQPQANLLFLFLCTDCVTDMTRRTRLMLSVIV